MSRSLPSKGRFWFPSLSASCSLTLAVSPGFIPRPSLSGSAVTVTDQARRVSPGFIPRPSLSVKRSGLCRSHAVVSPGFIPRPSLSVMHEREHAGLGVGVAGVHPPAFVERWLSIPRLRRARCVAGVHPPAFVERSRVFRTTQASQRVAGVHPPAFVERHRLPVGASGHLLGCRRGSSPGLR